MIHTRLNNKTTEEPSREAGGRGGERRLGDPVHGPAPARGGPGAARAAAPEQLLHPQLHAAKDGAINHAPTGSSGLATGHSHWAGLYMYIYVCI